MNRRPLVRSLLASAAILAAVALGGCDTDGTATPTLRSLQPLSPQMITEIERRNMSKESPILVRIFKEESELEVWKEDQSGRMALLKTYPICRWSGDLGPKIKQGDRQAPEGFYTITPSLMNPNSSYYLSINMGFPNAYDRANNRTGAFLMIHGDCSSRGCYAMTDEQIAEIYALARELFFGGQASFQIQAFPFRMTPQNMARHRNSPHMAFWRMLKTGYDHFEVTRQEPKVDVCDRRYVFNTETNGRYVPTAACPAMTTPDDVLAAVQDQAAARRSAGGRPGPARRQPAGGAQPLPTAACTRHSPPPCSRTMSTRTASSAPGSRPPAGTIPANIRIPTERERTLASRATTRPRPAASPSRWCAPTTRTAAARRPRAAAASSATCSRRAAQQQQRQQRQQQSRRRRRRDGPHGAHGRARRFEQRREAGAGAEGQARASEDRHDEAADDKKQPAKQTGRNKSGRHPPEERAGAAGDQQAAATQPPASGQTTINGAAADRADRQLRQSLRRLAVGPNIRLTLAAEALAKAPLACKYEFVADRRTRHATGRAACSGPD